MVAGSATAAEPVRYTLRFPDAASHHLEVEASYPAAGRAFVDLKMAVWTAYVIREYAQHVETLSATTEDGRPTRAFKTRKNRWRVETLGQPRVTVRYRLWANSLHVQDNFVSADFALLNGQPTFLTLAENEAPHEVRVETPVGWAVVSPLARENATWRAADYEELVDAPMLLGRLRQSMATLANGSRIHLVNGMDSGEWNLSRSIDDLKQLAETQAAMWGGMPCTDYYFFNVLSGKGGGMEHRCSTVMMASATAMKTREPYVRWLDLASHEFFHLWNVKRLRPREIIPGEYEQEQYTPSLGVAEGFTSYYAPLSLRRARLISEPEFWGLLSRLTEGLQATEGRRIQTLAESSFDTWIKFYRPNENTPRTTVSYYTKGAVVAFLLDARLRKQSGGQRSLDDVMREALRRYPVERGYTLDEFADVAGVDLAPWFHSTRELDYREAAEWFGLRISADGRIAIEQPSANRDRWLGAQ